jgi:hypothetical protein
MLFASVNGLGVGRRSHCSRGDLNEKFDEVWISTRASLGHATLLAFEEAYGLREHPHPPVREARVHRLFAIALTLLLVCFASSIAHAQSCTNNSNGRITLIPSANNPFPYDPGVNNPFPPGSSGPGPTHFSFNGLVGDTFNFQANPGPPGTSQIALLRPQTTQ